MRASLPALLILAIAGEAGAQDALVSEDTTVTESSRTEPGEGLGPPMTIEAIEVAGNTSTAARLIRRAVPIAPGDVVRAGDPRMRAVRLKVLSLGFFRDVEVGLRKGTAPGRFVLVVTVVERGTVVLDSLWFGNSPSTPWWAGAALSERNLLGTGLGVGGGLVYAADGDIAGDRPQWAARLRIDDASILGSPIGAFATLLYDRASEPYRIAGALDDTAPGNFAAFPYRRIGGMGGASVRLTPLSRVAFGGRLEWVHAEPALAPTRTTPDGGVVPIDLGLQPGDSRVATLSAGFERDTRADPILPYNGNRVSLLAELGAVWLGGSYNYGTLLARYQHWWAVRSPQHVLSLHLSAGVVVGDAPRFDRLHVSDFNRLLTPRALGLVVSTTPSRDLLGTATEGVTYGEVAGSAIVEYSYRLFRSRRHVYGGDLFVGAGLWALATTSRDLLVRDRSLYRSLPVDLVLDAGLRVDTEIGIFELTFANALGRVPL